MNRIAQGDHIILGCSRSSQQICRKAGRYAIGRVIVTPYFRAGLNGPGQVRFQAIFPVIVINDTAFSIYGDGNDEDNIYIKQGRRTIRGRI